MNKDHLHIDERIEWSRTQTFADGQALGELILQRVREHARSSDDDTVRLRIALSPSPPPGLDCTPAGLITDGFARGLYLVLANNRALWERIAHVVLDCVGLGYANVRPLLEVRKNTLCVGFVPPAAGVDADAEKGAA